MTKFLRSPIIYRCLSSAAAPLPEAALIEPANNPVFTKYGGRYTVSVIPGEGVGPEMTKHVSRVFAAVRAPVNFETIPLTSQLCSTQEIDHAIMSIRRNGVALKGNIFTPYDQLGAPKSINIRIRTELDLYAHLVKVKSIPGIRQRYNDINMVVIRENTEGEYSNLEHEATPGVVEMLKIVTRARSERIARFAFNYAKEHNRKKVTVVHKANIMKLSDGLFLECCREISRDFPDIEFGSMIVDNTCMQLVSRPQQFDVLVMPNLYGNIVSNIACGLVGGAGVVAGANFGEKFAVFEAGTRRRGRSIAGQDRANPAAFIFAGALLLDRLGLSVRATAVRCAVLDALADPRYHTSDIGGSAKASEVVDFVCDRVQQLVPDEDHWVRHVQSESTSAAKN